MAGGSDTEMNSTSPIPFGNPGFGSPMHQQSDNEDMYDTVNTQAPVSNLPFGTPPTTSSWGFGNTSTNNSRSLLSPIPESSVSNTAISSPLKDTEITTASGTEADNDFAN